MMLLLLASCAESGTPISGDARNVGDATLSLRIEPAQARLGSSIRLTVSLQNNAGRELALRFRTAQRYDFSVSREGREVWRWSSGRAFAQVITHDVVPGGSGIHHGESWRPDEKGVYEVAGVLRAEGFDRPLRGRVEIR